MRIKNQNPVLSTEEIRKVVRLVLRDDCADLLIVTWPGGRLGRAHYLRLGYHNYSDRLDRILKSPQIRRVKHVVEITPAGYGRRWTLETLLHELAHYIQCPPIEKLCFRRKGTQRGFSQTRACRFASHHLPRALEALGMEVENAKS